MRLIDLTGQRFGRLTVTGRASHRMYRKHVAWICRCDCGETLTTIASSLHRGATNSCGCIRRNDHKVITYAAAHIRVSQAKGRAAEHDCVDCGGEAHQWSYDHADSIEYVSPPRYAVYSLNPDRYEPRCRSCHHAQDRAHRARRGAAGVKPQTQTNPLTKLGSSA